ncbi:Cysteine protease xcp1 [Castilleja foliolosa]|uniref:Cysteine protease xcp1 n=1 Tax=Castilleja foliolosa TaxID=1961234 RepID=A0ABD3CBP1_9LAMI
MRNKAGLVKISGFQVVPENDQESFMKALAHQPVSLAIEGYGRDFQLCKGGVFNGKCGTQLSHAVTAIGYEKDYIIVKNSWGTGWGENGYMRMLRNNGHPNGLCGIYMWASYPII